MRSNHKLFCSVVFGVSMGSRLFGIVFSAQLREDSPRATPTPPPHAHVCKRLPRLSPLSILEYNTRADSRADPPNRSSTAPSKGVSAGTAGAPSSPAAPTSPTPSSTATRPRVSSEPWSTEISRRRIVRTLPSLSAASPPARTTRARPCSSRARFSTATWP